MIWWIKLNNIAMPHLLRHPHALSANMHGRRNKSGVADILSGH
jgi:hypothetical protein